MLVEDEPTLYEMMDAMFDVWGIEGVAFVDGSEAVSWIDAVDRGQISGDLPTLAILDIRLPTLSGPEVGARLRRSPKLHNIAIVLITAYVMSPEDEREAKALAQADAFIRKPLPQMDEFRKMLDSFVSKRNPLLAEKSA
jgi:CheY-like chemotaxis protein